jgi:hypothetical protein
VVAGSLAGWLAGWQLPGQVLTGLAVYILNQLYLLYCEARILEQWRAQNRVAAIR